jgi:hypothetical protein
MNNALQNIRNLKNEITKLTASYTEQIEDIIDNIKNTPQDAMTNEEYMYIKEHLSDYISDNELDTMTKKSYMRSYEKFMDNEILKNYINDLSYSREFERADYHVCSCYTYIFDEFAVLITYNGDNEGSNCM